MIKTLLSGFIGALILFACESTPNEIDYEYYENDSIKSKTYFDDSDLLVREEFFDNGVLNKKYVMRGNNEIYYRRHLKSGEIAGGRMSIQFKELNRTSDSIQFRVWPEYLDDGYKGFMIYVTEVDSNMIPSQDFKYALDSDTTYKEWTIPISNESTTVFSGILLESSRTGEGDTVNVGDGSQDVFKYMFSNEKGT